MGLIKFQICMEGLVYYAGQTVSGKLLMELDEPMSTSAIYLKYSGKAQVHWAERHRRGGESVTKNYHNEEHYLGQQQLVFGNGEEDSELGEGEHVFVFSFQLPINLPSSFEAENGRIRYSIKAEIKRSWKFNHTTKQPLTIISVCDLNRLPFAADPVTTITSKNFFGHTKPLLMTVDLPIRGYVPGQIMPVKISLKNESKVQVQSISITLEQHIRLHAIVNSKIFVKNIFKNVFPVVEGLGEEEVPLNLQLPALPPSNLDFCNIIDLNYKLKVTAKVKSWYHRSLSLYVDLIIGNIPVMSYQRPVPVHQLFHQPIDKEGEASHGQVPPGYGFVLPSETTYEDLPPPSYEKCMRIGSSEIRNADDTPDSDDENTDYTPLYAVYKFENSQT